MQEHFQKDLLKGEQILWVGQPDTSKLFTKADIFLIPFSLFWGGFAFIWEYLALTSVTKTEEGGITVLIFPLFGIPFVLMGLYFIFGRFLYKNWKKKRTWYAVTDKRALVLTQTFGQKLQAADLKSLPTMNKTIQKDGSGSVTFGNSSWMFSMYENTGMEIFGSLNGSGATSFYDIKDAEKVYQIANEQRS
jgi:hypothetical protein